MKQKHEKWRYQMIEQTFQMVGVRLYRLSDTDLIQKPADFLGFVLGDREDRGRMVMVEAKEVRKISECSLFDTKLFNMLSDNQKITLGNAAPNGCYCFVVVYCQEDGKLYVWKLPHIPGPFKKIGNTAPHLVLEKDNGSNATNGGVTLSPYFRMTKGQFDNFRVIFEGRNERSSDN